MTRPTAYFGQAYFGEDFGDGVRPTKRGSSARRAMRRLLSTLAVLLMSSALFC